VIRVPATKYQAFIDEAAKLGKVLIQTENTDDVTQQHIDLKARLDNLRAQETRLREFFAKAKTVSEMLQIENELSRVRGEIESMAAQVAYLERQAAMATVTIELAEPKPLVRPGGVDWGVGTAFTSSVRAFVGTLNVLIVMLGPILAIGLFIVLPAYLIGRFVWRVVRKRRAARTATAPVAPQGPAQS
jgi:Flp pilus assembly protein TadB